MTRSTNMWFERDVWGLPHPIATDLAERADRSYSGTTLLNDDDIAHAAWKYGENINEIDVNGFVKFFTRLPGDYETSGDERVFHALTDGKEEVFALGDVTVGEVSFVLARNSGILMANSFRQRNVNNATKFLPFEYTLDVLKKYTEVGTRLGWTILLRQLSYEGEAAAEAKLMIDAAGYSFDDFAVAMNSILELGINRVPIILDWLDAGIELDRDLVASLSKGVA